VKRRLKDESFAVQKSVVWALEELPHRKMDLFARVQVTARGEVLLQIVTK
jgi:3-methyladenine DNA glycosylase AlkD